MIPRELLKLNIPFIDLKVKKLEFIESFCTDVNGMNTPLEVNSTKRVSMYLDIFERFIGYDDINYTEVKTQDYSESGSLDRIDKKYFGCDTPKDKNPKPPAGMPPSPRGISSNMENLEINSLKYTKLGDLLRQQFGDFL